MEKVCIILAIIIYLAVLLYLGFKYSKKNLSVSDYYLGGRKLGPYVTAMSAEASDMSSWLLLGLPGVAYASGICDAFWTALGLGIGTYLNWLLCAKRLRHYTEITGSVTVPDFFENRFRDKSHILMAVSAIVIVIFFIPYTGSGFAACGKLFSSLFGIDYFVAMIISAVIIVTYTAAGGFLAASTTDFIQSVVMSVALICVVCFGVSCCGSTAVIYDYSHSLDGFMSISSMFSDTGAVPYGPITVLSTMAWGLGYFGMPHILLRFMAIEDPKKIKLSRRIGTVWVFIAMSVAIAIGVIARCMSHVGALGEADNFLADPETAVIEIANLLSTHGVLAAFLAGVIMAGILACTMSTCDSQLLAASSSISENILVSVLGIKIDEKKKMIIARVTLVIISIIGMIIARDPASSVFKIVSFAWAGFGGAFGPVMLLALFWKRTNTPGAIAGMISGGVMIFVWKFLVRPMGGALDIYELLPAFIVSLLFTVAVSLATKEPDKEIQKEFDKVFELSK
ncbi:MAG: sodium/proline symporter [Lachnospiraceae bacterium]|nr:sodium/proline symporter [Lachnospiraceae bacterium]